MIDPMGAWVSLFLAVAMISNAVAGGGKPMGIEKEFKADPFRAVVTASETTVNIEIFNLLCPSPLRIVSSSVTDRDKGATKSIRIHFSFRTDHHFENEAFRTSFDRGKVRKIVLSLRYPSDDEVVADDLLLWPLGGSMPPH